MNFRPLRVSNLVREELNALLLREVEFPGALVTITDVVVSPKLENAKVKVSVLPSPRAEESLRILRSRTGELQHLLNRKLGIRPMPHLHFELDQGPEKAANVEKILLDE